MHTATQTTMSHGRRRVLPIASVVTGLGLAASALMAPVGEAAPNDSEPDGEAQSSTPADCPNPYGGSCLGPLAAGTYTTSVFQPSITYTVPEGWENGEDLPGNFLLTRTVDPVGDYELQNFIGIYRDAVAPIQTCGDAADPTVETSAEAFTSWLAALPELESTEPQAVSVGGLDGYVVDLAWGEIDVWCPDLPPVVPILIGGGVSSLHHVIFEGATERIYVLDYLEGNVVIEVGQVPGETSFEEYVAAAQPIIDSLEFGDGPGDVPSSSAP